MESLVAAAISTKITGIKDSLVSAAISKRNKKGQQQIDKNQIDKKQIDKKQIKRDCNRDVPGRIEKKKRKLAYLGRVQRTLDIAIQVYIWQRFMCMHMCMFVCVYVGSDMVEQ